MSFAKGLNFYKQFWIFFIASFFGVVVEMLWCMFRFHTIESRAGLIYGPFNLVYGFGALFMTLVLNKLYSKNDRWIFLMGVLIGSVWEYACSLVQEKLFGSTSWNYVDFPLNLNGRVNLLYSIFWGILALLWVKEIYPFVSKLIEKIPNSIGKPLTWICLVFMVYNCIASAMVVYRMNYREQGVAPRTAIERVIDERYPSEKVKKIYPNMTFICDEECYKINA